MGTRGAVGFYVDGQEKIAYQQFDSYPSGVGVNVVEFCANHKPSEIAQIARGIILIDGESTPTKQQIKECKPWTSLDVSTKSTSDWYCLTRGAQGELEPYANGLRYMGDSKAFLADSLFCEFAYIINCDTEKLEFYRGFNHNPSGAGRYCSPESIFAHLIQGKHEHPGLKGRHYFPVTLVKEYPLADFTKAKLMKPVKVGKESGNEALPAVIVEMEKLTKGE